MKYIVMMYLAYIIRVKYLFDYNCNYIVGQDRMMRVPNRYEHTNYHIGKIRLEKSHHDLYTYIIQKFKKDITRPNLYFVEIQMGKSLCILKNLLIKFLAIVFI